MLRNEGLKNNDGWECLQLTLRMGPSKEILVSLCRLFFIQPVAFFVGKNVSVAFSRHCVTKCSFFSCQFLSAVGVLEKDCRVTLRSCRLSAKPLGRPQGCLVWLGIASCPRYA